MRSFSAVVDSLSRKELLDSCNKPFKDSVDQQQSEKLLPLLEYVEATKAIKLELEGEEKNFRSLDSLSRICSRLYNELVERTVVLKNAFQCTGDPSFSKMLYSKRGLRNLIPDIKKEFPFFKVVHSSPLKNVGLRLSASIQAYQKCKKGKRKGSSGWPRYRSWKKRWFSLLFDEPNKGYKVTGSTLSISLGRRHDGKKGETLSFHLKEVHLLKGYTPRNLRITKEAGKYYAIFTVIVKLPKKKPVKNAIALDPNHKNFAVGVDTNGSSIEIEAPFWLKKSRRRIDELKSKRDSCKKCVRTVDVLDDQGNKTGNTYSVPSRRYKKFEEVLKKASHKSREQKKTFMFSLSHRLVKHYDYIGIGDYAPHGNGCTRAMRRSMNNESLIGQFKAILQWTAAKSGKHCIVYDEKGTTRTCHVCRYEVPGGLDPSIRQWVCPVCQTMHIRDENAAQNGLAKILRDLNEKGELKGSQVPGSGLVPIQERWVWRVSPSGIFVSAAGAGTARNCERQKIKKESMMLSTKT